MNQRLLNVRTSSTLNLQTTTLLIAFKIEAVFNNTQFLLLMKTASFFSINDLFYFLVWVGGLIWLVQLPI
nr:hypothetical protein BCV29_11030 [Vibrio cyclitrophicus]